MIPAADITKLSEQISGTVYTDRLHRLMYATDASAYREEPLAVAIPTSENDLVQLILFAKEHGLSLIPRAAGTSLAGQVVGRGLVVDISNHFTNVLEINSEERWVRVQPGVVLDALNAQLKPYGLFFGPETSTSNRCCIGGMVGNNSCGSHSLVYGSTREHVLEVTCLLSDGSKATFRRLSQEEAFEKANESSLEGNLYKALIELLSDDKTKRLIDEHFPDKRLTRRNSGYAIDLLRKEWEEDKCINISKLICGSEGTLVFVTEVKLNLVPLPYKDQSLMCVHCNSLDEAFQANLVALKHKPVAIELIDDTILKLSKGNRSQNKNRFFIQGEPAAILVIELSEPDMATVDRKAAAIESDLRRHGYGYHFPRVYGSDMSSIWSLRKAGLGLLSTMPGDSKPVSLIEDTAVIPEMLPSYMKEMKEMLDSYGLSCVYHAHISTGELHLRPVLNLKDDQDRILFRKVAHDTALIVRKYRGSLSGEHGDGRLRGEFIPLLFGAEVYQLFVQVKHLFDPQHRFNPGKITDTEPMDTSLRYVRKAFGVKTYFDFSAQKGWLTAVEQCNGSGDCRKATQFGGVMCPTFRVTNDEKFTTRARANLMRESLLLSGPTKGFSQPEVLDVLADCLSCKGCKSECPSNVDMTKYKAEYLQHHYDETHTPFSVWLIANLSTIQRVGSIYPPLYNKLIRGSFTGKAIKSILHFAPERSLPVLYKYTLRKWMISHVSQLNHRSKEVVEQRPLVLFFVDEFTNYLDVTVGIRFVELLNSLGYRVEVPEHVESGRTALSMGLLKKARQLARKNIELLADIVTAEAPLVGIEPSGVLTFRDEYLDLAGPLKSKALTLASNVLLYDEFFVREINEKRINANQFTDKECTIYLHGHCHQKSLASVEPSKIMLSLPSRYTVHVIPAGCCGMAGQYGYKKSHYALSMAIGEEVLFPAVRSMDEDALIAAPGSSCRQQIKDGTGRMAFHPVEILHDALLCVNKQRSKKEHE